MAGPLFPTLIQSYPRWTGAIPSFYQHHPPVLIWKLSLDSDEDGQSSLTLGDHSSESFSTPLASRLSNLPAPQNPVEVNPDSSGGAMTVPENLATLLRALPQFLLTENEFSTAVVVSCVRAVATVELEEYHMQLMQ